MQESASRAVSIPAIKSSSGIQGTSTAAIETMLQTRTATSSPKAFDGHSIEEVQGEGDLACEDAQMVTKAALVNRYVTQLDADAMYAYLPYPMMGSRT